MRKISKKNYIRTCLRGFIMKNKKTNAYARARTAADAADAAAADEN